MTATATDDAGNKATCTFTVTVQDTGKPTITCPDAITVNAPTTGPATTVSWDAPATSDNWGVDSVTSTVASGTSFGIGSRAVTYTVTDKAGLKETCTFTVAVKDVTAPILTCPADIAIDTDAGKHTGMHSLHYISVQLTYCQARQIGTCQARATTAVWPHSWWKRLA